MTDWLNSSEMRAWRNSIEGITKLVEVLEGELKAAHGVSIAEYSVLVHLSEARPAAMRMSDLADRAVVSRSQLTHLANRMERAKLLVRRPDPDDGRGVVSEITEAGQAALEAAAPTHLVGVRRYMIDLLNGAEIEVIGQAMEKIHHGVLEGSHSELADRTAS